MKTSSGLIKPTRDIVQRILMAIVMLAITVPAMAEEAIYQLNVTYTGGEIISGPLSFGLSTLPDSVNATFVLGAGYDCSDPIENIDRLCFDEDDVISASATFGDASWSIGTGLESFFMSYAESVRSINYKFEPVATSPTTTGIIILNSPLKVTGTDVATGETFEYGYTEYLPTLEAATLNVTIDIKPGDSPNCFNVNGHGIIPVAILGSTTLNVEDIDLTSLSFGGLEVRIRGNKGPLCSAEHANDDAYLDLVCHFEDDPSAWSVASSEATLSGSLNDGAAFEGSDSICVVP